MDRRAWRCTLQSMALKGVLGMNTVFMELEFGSFSMLDE